MVDRKLPMAAMAALLFAVLISQAYSQSNAQRKQSGAGAMHMNPGMKLAEANLAEIEMGKMAAEKAMNPRVKEFAETMVKDHTDGLNKVRAADSSLPADMKMDARNQRTYDRLSKLSGAEFDREYMRAMVADHQADLRYLEQLTGMSRAAGKRGAGGTQRQKPMMDMSATVDMANVAQELLPTIKHHLQMAQEIQKVLQTANRQ